MSKWTDPADMPLWWYRLSAFLAAVVFSALMVASVWLIGGLK